MGRLNITDQDFAGLIDNDQERQREENEKRQRDEQERAKRLEADNHLEAATRLAEFLGNELTADDVAGALTRMGSQDYQAQLGDYWFRITPDGSHSSWCVRFRKEGGHGFHHVRRLADIARLEAEWKRRAS